MRDSSELQIFAFSKRIANLKSSRDDEDLKYLQDMPHQPPHDHSARNVTASEILTSLPDSRVLYLHASFVSTRADT